MQQQPIEVVLVKGREKSLLKRHPGSMRVPFLW